MKSSQEKRQYLLDGIQHFLKNRGFKKKSFTFKRESEKGLLQIIELSLGPSWSSVSGKVNLEFGIYSDEWQHFFSQSKTPSTIRTPDCEVRDCYCGIVDQAPNYNWFELGDNQDDLILDMINVLDESIIPYLDRHKTRKEILESYERHGEQMGLPPRHKLSIAVLTYSMGERERGLQLAYDELLANQKNSFYNSVFEKLKADFQKTTL